MDTAIRVENLSKQYRIGVRRARNLREALSHSLRKPFAKLFGGNGRPATNGSSVAVAAESAGQGEDRIWALKDVSFEVKHGEVIGIIGRNGAGKSTLLKILSRITEPTAGRVEINGRVASLLEVGTGFHHELTGRENVFLNGAILGMKRAEIARRFDDIVAFAEVEKFIDTPVKHYSSGMYMRLAFAVAAHLEPEILIVDEVLAVGDAGFQKKCLGKMKDLGSSHRTVIFVSHSISIIQRLCGRCVLLQDGRILRHGDTVEVTKSYMEMPSRKEAGSIGFIADGQAHSQVATIASVRVLDNHGRQTSTIDIQSPFAIEVTYDVHNAAPGLTALLQISNEDGLCLFASGEFAARDWEKTPRGPGRVTAICRVPGSLMAEGQHYVLAAVGRYNPNQVFAKEHDAAFFQIVDSSESGGVRGEHAGEWPGLIRPRLEWDTAYAPRGAG